MGAKKRFTTQQFKAAVRGSTGNITVIAERLACTRETVYKYLEEKPILKTYYEEECERLPDVAELLIVTNMQLLRQQQVGDATNNIKPQVVDTRDAWEYLKGHKRGRERGYGNKVDVNVTGNITWKELMEQDGNPDAKTSSK